MVVPSSTCNTRASGPIPIGKASWPCIYSNLCSLFSWQTTSITHQRIPLSFESTFVGLHLCTFTFIRSYSSCLLSSRLMISVHEDGFKFVNYRTKEVMLQFSYNQVWLCSPPLPSYSAFYPIIPLSLPPPALCIHRFSFISFLFYAVEKC